MAAGPTPEASVFGAQRPIGTAGRQPGLGNLNRWGRFGCRLFHPRQ